MVWQQGLGEKRAEFGSVCNAFRCGQRESPQKVVHVKVQLLRMERRWRNQAVLIWSNLVACDGRTFDFGSNSMIQMHNGEALLLFHDLWNYSNFQSIIQTLHC
jgi:hypothetical protein